MITPVRAFLTQKKRGIFIFLVYCIALFLLLHQQVMIAFMLIFFVSIVEISAIKQQLIAIIKHTFTVKFYGIIVWFLSYLIALKSLSYFKEINEENLKFAPAIMAIPISISIICGLVVAFSLIMTSLSMIINSLVISISSSLKHKAYNSSAYRFMHHCPHLMILPIPILMLMGYLISPLAHIALLTDSAFISDCGVKALGKTYLRRNEETCLEFDLTHLLNDPTVIVSKTRR